MNPVAEFLLCNAYWSLVVTVIMQMCHHACTLELLFARIKEGPLVAVCMVLLCIYVIMLYIVHCNR